ncbi:MAG: lantibiotic dehydratase family protein [Bacteroidales bacterium]|nr:lantibiotic dehydratase family protein [Bacteroidales bacterium]
MNKTNKNIAYQPFNTFVFRTPHISFQEFEENIKRLEEDENYWQEFLQNKSLQEAIFFGTPILYDEIQKFIAGSLTVLKEVNRLKLSILRYYARMSTRCTPFGLFAGFSLGNFDNATKIILSDANNYSRYTRLDMNYLCNLAQDIDKLPEVRTYLNYFPNSSIYPLGNKLRYVEYYYKNAQRIHNISAVDNSEYLTVVLEKARAGCKIEELAALLVNDEITQEEAMAFIQELIDSQLLVSELEPAITGKDFLIQLSTVLQSIPGMEEKNEKLTKIAALLAEIDSSATGGTLPKYTAVEEIVKELGTAYELKFLFQTDMFKPVYSAVLHKNIMPSVQEALELMNKLTKVQSETLLSKFADNYYERYEDGEMPLLEVLDTETGIGYRQSSGDISPLLAGYVLPAQQSDKMEIKWDSIQSVLHKKFLEAHKANAYTVNIEEKDFDFSQANWNDLHPTIFCMCELLSNEVETPLIYIQSVGGSSAANMLGRFCHVNKELEDYVKEITAFEQTQTPDVILAEIVHLPESRIGNILLRPVLRPYEIPYLGKSSVKEEFQISLSDLYVSVRGKTVFLRSKRLNKTIVPRLSTAHNYSFNSMPVYHFLCDMQAQSLRGGIGFYWGSLSNEYDFLPRVMYKNIVLSLAKWTVKTADFIKLLGLDDKKQDKNMGLQLPENAIDNLKQWRNEKQIPRYVVLPDGDNELFVDMENSLSIQTLISVIKKRSSFQLQEFPFEKEKATVKNEAGQSFTNEFIFGFYKSQKHE